MDIPGKGLIFFEGQTLPEASKHFELACFWKKLSTEIREWTLDLKYSWARWREAPSGLILRGCEEFESHIYSEHTDLIAGLRKEFSEDGATTICHKWISSINTMRTCAEKKDVCRWTISPLEDEAQHFLGVVTRIIQTNAKTLETGKFKFSYRDKAGKIIHEIEEDVSEKIKHNDGKLYAGLSLHFVEYLEYLKKASEEEQIAFIHQVTDSYTDSAFKLDE
jgi:hypothetical protein